MKYIILSDIHSNLQALEAVYQSFPDEAYEIFCAGDIIGYGADPESCIRKVQSTCKLCVLGNHDAAVIGQTATKCFNPYARAAVEWTSNILYQRDVNSYLRGLLYKVQYLDMTFVHGTLDNPEGFIYLLDEYQAKKTFEALKTKICFIGHSHIPAIYEYRSQEVHLIKSYKVDLSGDSKYIVNVGSVGQPRDGDPGACYCVYSPESKHIELKRVAYDIQKARKRIINAGLPEILGNRLLLGR